MPAAPKFSRVVTVYGQWRFLDWLANDALFDADTEFIVVDDASPAAAPPDVAARLASRGILVHRLPRNSGRCIARNTGAALARGEFLDFIDGDDRPLPLRDDPSWAGANIVYFRFAAHGAATNGEPSWLLLHPLLADPQAPDGFLDPRPVAVLWRREAFLATGGFDPRFEMNEDLDLAIKTLDQPRAFSREAKQSYFEHAPDHHVQMAAAGVRIALYRRLPANHPRRAPLLEAEVRRLHFNTTWLLLRGGHRGYLFRSALALLWNLLKSLFRPTPPA